MKFIKLIAFLIFIKSTLEYEMTETRVETLASKAEKKRLQTIASMKKSKSPNSENYHGSTFQSPNLC